MAKVDLQFRATLSRDLATAEQDIASLKEALTSAGVIADQITVGRGQQSRTAVDPGDRPPDWRGCPDHSRGTDHGASARRRRSGQSASARLWWGSPEGATVKSFGRVRRGLLKMGLAVPYLSVALHEAAARQPQLDRSSGRRLLKDAKAWGVQYQKVDVGLLASSHLDIIVLDPSLNDSARRFISRSEMDALKRKPDGSRRLVIGYLCIGEADLKRWYWPPQWRSRPPAWVGPDNVNWPGSRWFATGIPSGRR